MNDVCVRVSVHVSPHQLEYQNPKSKSEMGPFSWASEDSLRVKTWFEGR